MENNLIRCDIYYWGAVRDDDENANITLIQTENVNEINQINKVNIRKERLILAKEQ